MKWKIVTISIMGLILELGNSTAYAAWDCSSGGDCIITEQLQVKQINNDDAFALNAYNDGSWGMFDKVGGLWNLGLVQKTGNVGVGTTSPSANLHVYDTTGANVPIAIIEHVGSLSSSSYRDGFSVGEGTTTGDTMLSMWTDGTNKKAFIEAADWSLSYDIPLVLNANGGDVGVGTTNPLRTLHVNTTDSEAARFEGITSSGFRFELVSAANEWEFGMDSDEDFIFYDVTGGTTPFTIQNTAPSGSLFIEGATGDVGIGTTSPASRLEVKSSGAGTNVIKALSSDDDGLFLVVESGAGHGYVLVKNSSGSSMAQINSDGNSYFNGGNVGIGTSIPTNTLEVVGDFVVRETDDGNNAAMINSGPSGADLYLYSTGTISSLLAGEPGIDSYINNGGNVGIGTDSPDAKLEVVGGAGEFEFRLNSSDANPDMRFAAEGDDKVGMIYDRVGNVFVIHVNDSGVGFNEDSFSIAADGNVGIGTTIPQSKLAVNGTITAQEIKVTDTGWADYVFEDTYKLPSLDSVESYIKENKHLPDLPSAKEIEEDGLAVSEMLAMQMQKIEELTLYLIELKNENGVLHERLSALEVK